MGQQCAIEGPECFEIAVSRQHRSIVLKVSQTLFGDGFIFGSKAASKLLAAAFYQEIVHTSGGLI